MAIADEASEHLTLREAARRIGVHENTVRNWVDRGLLQPMKIQGSRYQRFRADDVDRLAHRQEVSSEKARRAEGATELVDADFLDAWATSRQAEGLLPDLVKQLIERTAGVAGVHVRSGDGVRVTEWDALVEDSPGTPWVPAGPSAWEMSTSGHLPRKADENYTSRTAKPFEVEPSVTTFVYVTPRRWPGARKWERERRKDKRWRDVRALDADDLVGWLRSQPATHLWLSEKVGLQPLEVRTLSQWWQRFSRQTEPHLPAKFVLAGRDEAVRTVRNELQSDSPSAIYVRAASREEATAFIAAALATADGGPVEALLTTSPQWWERLSVASQPSVLVPYFDDPHIASAVGSGHRVIVPLPAGTTRFRHDVVELGPLDRNEARDALLETKAFTFAKADHLAGLARRSLASFLRAPEVATTPRSRPAWAQGDQARLLGSLVLAGAWAPTEADQQAVARIADRDWRSVEDALLALTASSDPPFVRAGEGWQVVSSDGAWALLHQVAQSSDLQRFCDTAVEVLGETDPALTLDREERLLANVRGIRRTFSPTLSEGVARGLALLGGFDEDQLPHRPPGRDYALAAVRQLLQRANADESGLLWRSLSPYLQLLAEAAPTEFLDAVEAGLGGDTPLLSKLFTDNEHSAGLGSSSEHTGLLWALELLCWAPEHLPRAAGALARLTQIDPGGKLGNRPDRSLRTVFLPWIPQTSASLNLRLDVLDRFRRRYPDVAWKLLLAIMPSSHDVSSFTPRPRFQQWPTTDERAPLSEWLEAIARVTTWVIEDAGQDPGRWSELVSHIADLPREQRDEFLGALERLSPTPMQSEPRTKLWQTLHDLIGQHREFSDARWALDHESLKRLEAAAEGFKPEDPVGRFAYLFDWHPHLPGVSADDFEARDRAASQARAEAVRSILNTQGFEGVERLAKDSKVPEFVGVATAEVAPGEHLPELRGLLGRTDALRRFAHGWVAKMADDASWLEARAPEVSSWSVASQVGFLLALGAPTTRTVALIDSLKPTVQRQYWETLRPVLVEEDALHDVVERLLGYDRPWVGIDILNLACHRSRQTATTTLSAEQVVDVLDRALTSDSPDPGVASRAAYEIGQLLDYLEGAGVDDATLVRFEWSFFRVLEHTRPARALYRGLAADPQLFVDLVCRVYRAKNTQPSGDGDEHAAGIAQNAWSVLHRWRPRLDDPSGINSETLRAWVDEARRQLADRDREDIGDHQIGQTLSEALPDGNGTWPPEAIRDIIENLESTNLESGLVIGALNSRGTTTRGVYDGGAQERALAAKYRAWGDAVAARWPRTGRLLRQLAEDYERQARREDQEAQALANDL